MDNTCKEVMHNMVVLAIIDILEKTCVNPLELRAAM